MFLLQIITVLLNVSFPFEKQIISFFLWVDSIGYKLFSIFYKTFIKLAQQEMFNVDTFESIFNNIYVIFGIVALFIIAYLLLKMMINPDADKGNKEIKEMLYRFVFSMILICLLPTIFNFLKDFQNALLEYNVVPKVLLNNEVAVQYVDEDGNPTGNLEYIDTSDVNLTTEVMEYRANQMISYIVGGLMYPLTSSNDSIDGKPAERVLYTDPETGGSYYKYIEEDGSEWTTNVSSWWDGGAKAKTGLVGCGLGIAGYGLVLYLSAGALAVFGTGAFAGIISCLGGATVNGIIINGVASISATEYTWTNALQAITMNGDFTQISLFAQEIADGRFHYTPIISTIVVGILVYMMISFCIDIVVRTAKLLFYQLLAPLCFMISVIPKKKDLLNNWFKLVISTYLELFLRIACICAIVLLVGNLDLDRLTNMFHPIITTFVILGMVIFAKQIPKLFKELTGIDSSSIKLGIKDKLKEGGLFTASHALTAAGSAIGGLVFSKGNPLAALRAGKAGWKNGNLKSIGVEDTRRKAWEDATGKGARRRDLMIDDFRSSFGFETTAEAAERRVRQGKLPNGRNIIVTNTSGSDIQYGDTVEEFLKANDDIEMTEKTVEKMKSRMKTNEGKMAPTETRIKELEKKQKFVKNQRSLKDSYESEADKKWKDDKYSIDVYYQDSTGKIFMEKIAEKRFDELVSKGVKFLDPTKQITYSRGDEIFEISELSQDIISAINNGEIDLKSAGYIEENKTIRENMRREFIKKEMNTNNYNLMISATEEFLRDLQKDEFTYESIVMENGKVKLDVNGNVVRNSGKISYDGEIITQIEIDENGEEKHTTFKNLGYGIWEKDSDGKKEKVESMDIATLFDDKAKETLNAIEYDIKSQKQKIQSIKEENENIQELVNQYDKAIAQELENPVYRAYRASSEYKSKNK